MMSVSLFHERLIIMAKSNKNLHLTPAYKEIYLRKKTGDLEETDTFTIIGAITT